MTALPRVSNFVRSQVEFAVAAVREASLLVSRVQQELAAAALAKKDRSPVTVADFAAQAVVAERLAMAFPDDVLVGEEDSSALREAANQATVEQITAFVRTRFPEVSPDDVCQWIDRGAVDPAEAYWTLDPVDGTKGFLRGDQYAIALAYVEGGRVQIGVLGCPELEEGVSPHKGGAGSLVVAVRGAGTRVGRLGRGTQGELTAEGWGAWPQIRVSGVDDPRGVRLLRSVEAGHTDTGGIGRLVSELGIVADPVPMDSQAKYAVLAAGGGDALLRLLSPQRPDYREQIWDQAAGSLVVEEAGGRVTDLDGKPLDFSQGRQLARNRGVVATNGWVHEAVLAAVERIGA